MLHNTLAHIVDTDRLFLDDSCPKEVARVISALYQENYKKFQVLVLISGMNPNAISKFSGNCVFCA